MKARLKFMLYPIIASLIFTLAQIPIESASGCVIKECLSVRTNDESDEVIITLNTGASKKIARSEPKKRVTAQTSGSISAMADPDRTWIPYHPDIFAAWKEAARKAAATRKNQGAKINRPQRSVETAEISLSDQVSQLIPIGDIQFQPSAGATINKKVYFWTTTPMKFSTVLKVGAIPVRIDLEPEFSWSYGEAEEGSSTSRGAPYPIPLNVYTYHQSGVKTVNLKTLWRGTFTVAGVESPIDGVITQNRSRNIEVFPAPHRVIR
jgi:hypothetical protein